MDLWDRFSAAVGATAPRPTDVAVYGADLPTEADLRLLGSLAGKRVLELGCGDGGTCVAFAKQGATAIGVDSSPERLAGARLLAEREEVKIEVREGDLADLAFLRADSIDVAFSALAFGFVEDLGRVLRQVHRVLKGDAPLVFSIRHPASALIDERSDDPLLVRRSYFETGPIERSYGGIPVFEHRHSMADLYSALLRSGFRVDAIVEPEPPPGGPRSAWWHDAHRLVPQVIVIRARKDGA